MDSLKGLIKCGICGKNYNYKNNNGTEIYICQTQKNKGLSVCNSQKVKRLFVMDIIEKHCLLYDKNFTIGKIKLFVREIRVTDTEVKIFYKDGTVSIINSGINSSNIVF